MQLSMNFLQILEPIKSKFTFITNKSVWLSSIHVEPLFPLQQYFESVFAHQCWSVRLIKYNNWWCHSYCDTEHFTHSYTNVSSKSVCMLTVPFVSGTWLIWSWILSFPVLCSLLLLVFRLIFWPANHTVVKVILLSVIVIAYHSNPILLCSYWLYNCKYFFPVASC